MERITSGVKSTPGVIHLKMGMDWHKTPIIPFYNNMIKTLDKNV
jgi:hypothetical protein